MIIKKKAERSPEIITIKNNNIIFNKKRKTKNLFFLKKKINKGKETKDSLKITPPKINSSPKTELTLSLA